MRCKRGPSRTRVEVEGQQGVPCIRTTRDAGSQAFSRCCSIHSVLLELFTRGHDLRRRWLGLPAAVLHLQARLIIYLLFNLWFLS